MAIPIKSDLIEQFYWEAGRWATLAIDPDRTDTGAYSETSTTSGVTYSGTDGTDGLLDQLATALDDYNIRASDWNAIASEINNIINNEISPLKQEILEIKSKLEQEGIIDFANETGYGAFFTFEDTDGINTGSTTATINTVGKQVEFDDTGSEVLVLNNRTLSNEFTEVALRLYPNGGVTQGESDGNFTNVSTIDLLSPGFTLTTNEKLWINATEVDITGVTGGSTIIDRTTPVQVVGSSYTTSSSARPQRLSNGWIVTTENDNAGNIRFQVDKQDGNGFVPLGFRPRGSIVNFSVVSEATTVHLIISSTALTYYSFDATESIGDNDISTLPSYTIKSVDTQTTFEGCSLTIAPNGDLHAAWASKNATYPNSFNIRYSKSIDGGSTWDSPTQVSTDNTATISNESPSIVIMKNGYPHITMLNANTAGNWALYGNPYNGSIWDSNQNGKGVLLYNGGNHVQSNPSSDILSDGTIIVAWQGRDASNPSIMKIRFSQSTDNGVNWSAMEVLSDEPTRNQEKPTITRDLNNIIYVVWEGLTTASPSAFQVRMIQGNTGAWGSIEEITTNLTSLEPLPSSLNNYRNFEKPLIIYRDGLDSDVKFYGKWTVGGAFTLTLGSNVTLIDGQQVPITGVFTPIANIQTMNISDVTSEYYYYERAVTSSDTLALQTTGKSINLDILTYSLG